jgi:hypothetical protein
MTKYIVECQQINVNEPELIQAGEESHEIYKVLVPHVLVGSRILGIYENGQKVAQEEFDSYMYYTGLLLATERLSLSLGISYDDANQRFKFLPKTDGT